MAITVQMCSSNAVCDDIQTINWLIQTFPNVQVQPADCLGRCGICIKYAYVLINEDFIYADSVTELQGNIKTYLNLH